jgi:hypothetical protein
MQQSPRLVKSPLNFLRRAIQENWMAETMPEKVDQPYHLDYYVRRVYTIDEAREIVQKKRSEGGDL